VSVGRTSGEASLGTKEETAMKRLIFDECLSLNTLMVIFEPDAPGVEIPVSVKKPMLDEEGRSTDKHAMVVFDYGLDMPKPIDDLDVSDDGIRATLSINNEPHATFVPWNAIVHIAMKDNSFVASWPPKDDGKHDVTKEETAMKRLIFDECLSLNTLMVIFEPDAPGVEIPVSVKKPMLDEEGRSTGKHALVIFDYGLDMPKPIDDLDVSDEGIRATLSINNEPHATFVPWDSIVHIAMKDNSFVASWPPKDDGKHDVPRVRLEPAKPGLKLVK
jgi:hypothetical protein